MTTFLRWLQKQEQRDDPVGDLAQDMRQDQQGLLYFFGATTLPNPPLSRFYGYLRSRLACSEALQACIDAYREWQQLGNTYRATRNDRKRPAGWLKLRFSILQRDDYRCQVCGRGASATLTLEVDHKVPRSKGGTDDPSNLWTLCFDCNRGKRDALL